MRPIRRPAAPPPAAPPAGPSARDAALARANERLAAKRRENRRKSSLVLSVSVLALFVPIALFAGLDLSGWFYPSADPGPEDVPQAVPPDVVGQGSLITVELVGTLDNGTQFVNGTTQATVGDGTWVPGLERALLGLSAGDNFTVTVAPGDGYGNWSASRTYHVAPFENISRNQSMEIGNFDDRWPGPTLGQVVPTRHWPSVVTSIGSKYVHLQYQPTVGETLRYHTHWDSRVVSFNNSSIRLENLLHVGYTYTRNGTEGSVLTYVLTKIDSRGYLFDRNPPLAGQTLHFTGRVVSAQGGTMDAARAVPAVVTGRPQSMGPQPCSRCHGGFVAVDAAAVAVPEGTGLRVNVTVANPWKHELTRIDVRATAFEANASLSAGSTAAPDIPRGGSAQASLLLTQAPAVEGTVRVVVNATAFHAHRSSGRHDANPYEMAIDIPISAPETAPAAAVVPATTGPPAAQTPAEFWGLAGQWAGFVALAAACLPATQGLKRHAGLKPRFKVPVWLTAHYTMSVAVCAASTFHAIALMSTTYHGAWTWDVWAGVVGLGLLAGLGISGVVLAKWTPLKWKRIKRAHYFVVTGFIFAGALHVIASSTTLRWALGV